MGIADKNKAKVPSKDTINKARKEHEKRMGGKIVRKNGNGRNS